MTIRLLRFSVISVFLALLFCGPCFAEAQVGAVTQLQGTVSAVKEDGRSRALAVKSAVELSDTVITEKKSLARIRFIDNGEVILRPRTQFKVKAYNFEQGAPARDNAVFNLVKGGARFITGQISKRVDPGRSERYKAQTNTSIAGVRGTIFDVLVCENSSCAPNPDGDYFYVVEGSITLTNDTGTKVVGAGQYAYVRSRDSEPRILPGDPGVDFGLPRTFLEAGKDRQNIYCVDCLVR